jgi:hypothetical protein
VTWWAWTVGFVLLGVAAAALAFLQLRTLWRKAAALLAELGAMTERLAEVGDALARPPATGSEPAPQPAVFDDPLELRRRRLLTRSGGFSVLRRR